MPSSFSFPITLPPQLPLTLIPSQCQASFVSWAGSCSSGSGSSGNSGSGSSSSSSSSCPERLGVQGVAVATPTGMPAPLQPWGTVSCQRFHVSSTPGRL